MADNKRTLKDISRELQKAQGDSEFGSTDVNMNIVMDGGGEAQTINEFKGVDPVFSSMLEYVESIYTTLNDYFFTKELEDKDWRREQRELRLQELNMQEGLITNVSDLNRSFNEKELPSRQDSSEGGMGLGAMFAGLTGGPIKGLKGLGRLLLRFGGPLAAIGAVIRFATGFKNAEDIIGDDDLTLIQRIGAGASQIISDMINLFTRIANFFLPESLELGNVSPQEVYATISNLFAQIGGYVDRLISVADQYIVEPFKNLVGWVTSNFQGETLKDRFINLGTAAWNEFISWPGKIWAAFTGFLTNFTNTDNIVEAWLKLSGDLAALVIDLPRIIMNKLYDFAAWVTGENQIVESMRGLANDILDAILAVPDAVVASFQAGWATWTETGSITAAFMTLAGTLWDEITGIPDKVMTAVTGLFDVFIGETGVGSYFSNMVDSIWNKITGIPDAVLSSITGLFNIFSSGEDVEESAVRDSFNRMVGGIWDSVTGIPDKVLAAITGVFDIFSSDDSEDGGIMSSFQKITDTIWDNITSIPDLIVEKVQGWWDEITSIFDSIKPSAIFDRLTKGLPDWLVPDFLGGDENSPETKGGTESVVPMDTSTESPEQIVGDEMDSMKSTGPMGAQGARLQQLIEREQANTGGGQPAGNTNNSVSYTNNTFLNEPISGRLGSQYGSIANGQVITPW